MSGRKALLAVWLLLTAAYLVWRVVWSMNPEAPVWSVVFFGAEIWGITSSIIFYWIIFERRDAQPGVLDRAVSVDVLICTYNEPPTLVRHTIRRALALAYPHRTWVLDDGNRPEMRALAAELGAEYLAREDNRHFKAGNLNNALAHTDGELLVVLDADHLLRSEYLDALLGYFEDPDVALVQIPQVFYNVDSFQHHFRPGQKKLWHEGAIFHHAMQPGANRFNSAFFVGTGATVRRAALEEIGGFATGSVTEDVFTSMRMHARGWKTIYHDEPLGYLLAPESLHQYLTQRLRWGQGSMQILRTDNPLFKAGLSWRQRIIYFNAFSSFSQAFVHLIYYLAPAIFLLGGPAPLRVDRLSGFLPIVAHVAVDLAFFRLMLGALGRPLLAECYKFLNLYAFLKALTAYFRPGSRLKFQVTTKGRDAAVSLRLLMPQIALLLLEFSAFGWGLIHLTHTQPTLVHTLGIGIAWGFAGIFVVVGSMTLVFAAERLAARTEYTFPDRIRGHLQTSSGSAGDIIVARANEGLLHVLVPEAQSPVGQDEEVELSLHFRRSEPSLPVPGRVRRVVPTAEGDVLEVSLSGLSLAASDRLFDRFVEVSIPRVIDRLMRPWGVREPVSLDVDSSIHYLPVEMDVL